MGKPRAGASFARPVVAKFERHKDRSGRESGSEDLGNEQHPKEVEGKMFYLTTHSTHIIYGYMEGRKEMFYLTMHSTHFIYGYMEGRNEMFYFTTHSTHII